MFDLSKVGMRGVLKAIAHYAVKDGTLWIDCRSQCDTRTLINLTNHVYFNLSSHNEPIEDHEFRLFAESFVNVDDDNILTGDLTPIDESLVYRLTKQPPFTEFDGLVDHHFNSDSSKLAAVKSLTNGIRLEVLSNAPGFQFYTGKFLAAPPKASSGFCIETQLAPDAANQADFYSPVLKVGETLKQTTAFKFSM